MIKNTRNTKPGGLDGNEIINFQSRKGNSNEWFKFETSLQEIAALAPTIEEILELSTSELDTNSVLKPDGAGGVEWGVDSSFTPIDGNGTTVNGNAIDLGSATPINSNILIYGDNGGGFSNGILLSSNALRTAIGDVSAIGVGENGGAYVVTELNSLIARYSSTFLEINSAYQMILSTPSGLFCEGLKSGATQVAAGAATNELWVTSGHATLPDGVLNIGL
jgi:hypothetical protein